MGGIVKRKEETGRRREKIRRRRFLSEKKNQIKSKNPCGYLVFFLLLDLIDLRNAS